MFTKTDVGQSTDENGNRVSSADRYTLKLECKNGDIYLIGLDPGENIVLNARDVVFCAKDGQKQRLLSPQNDLVLELARDGLSVLTRRRVDISR